MPITFQLYMLVNPAITHSYPYVGVSSETTRLINIYTEHIGIAERSDSLFYESDHVLTSRSFSFDLPLLDELIGAYIGPYEYGVICRFNEEKHITLRYHSPRNECAKDYDIFIGYPDTRAEQLVETIYPFFDAVRKEVFF